MKLHRLLVLCLVPFAPFSAPGELAEHPPMGWNSWDSFGTTVTESEVKANAQYMAEHLAAFGWQYVVVDIQWSEMHPKTHGYRPNAELNMDEFGRLIPASNRFPSSAGGVGFKPLADYVHAKGLKFGIHIMRGIPRRAVDANLPIAGAGFHAADVADKQSICPWNSDMYGVDVSKPGGQEYYDSIVSLYAKWGVDFIKADDMFGFGPHGDHDTEIEAVNRAIAKSGRPIVLSLSPGTRGLSHAEFASTHAQMWRISNDFWDRWVDLKNQFPLFDQWTPFRKPGHWPDGDMLPLGRIGIRAERGDPRFSLFTHDEQRTLMTLWSIAKSPLMFGGNLPDNDAFTLDLITNREVLDVDQNSVANRQLFARGNHVAWVAERPGSGGKYLAVFNTGDSAREDIEIKLSDLGLPERVMVKDLWTGMKLEDVKGSGKFAVGPHASRMYWLSPTR